MPTAFLFHVTVLFNTSFLFTQDWMSINSRQEFLTYRFIFWLPIIKIVGQIKDTIRVNINVLLMMDLGYGESIAIITAIVTHNAHATLIDVKLITLSLISKSI